MPLQNPLKYIERYESGGKNVFNYKYDSNPRLYSAGGFFQITNSTWKYAQGLPGAPAEMASYARAIDAPYSVQQGAAAALYNADGFSHWAPYNPSLRSAISSAGGTSAFIQPGSLSTSAGGVPGTSQSGVNDYVPSPPDHLAGTPLGEPGLGYNKTLGDGQPLFLTVKPNKAPVFDGTEDYMPGGPEGTGGSSNGSGSDLNSYLKRRSRDLVEATDKQNRAIRETQQEEEAKNRAQDQAQYDATKGTFTDYFARVIFVIVGLIVLAAGLWMFARPQMIAAVASARKVIA